ncbi:hypothetical protein TL16_g06341 [Triparma laevis f. inornata]|uniref:Uncharacterized protein n=1 Tax=Triparma laevis f. inornata TaxID=1714386 RepID=A0A9W7AU61_9STRA|nr:hypothetical protein TL16_g06341 [Triparma laevis f. inornata]
MGKSQYARKADNNQKRKASRRKEGQDAQLKSLVAKAEGNCHVYESLLDDEFAEASESQRNSTTDSRWVCADHLFREGCRERKCRRNHDVTPISEIVTTGELEQTTLSSSSRPRSKSRSTSMSECGGVCVQSYVCLKSESEKKSWRPSGEVVYVVVEGALVYNRDSGGFVKSTAAPSAPPTPPFPPLSPTQNTSSEGLDLDLKQASITLKSNPTKSPTHFPILPEFVLGHILTFIEDVGDFGRVGMTCKLNLEIFTSPTLIQIINKNYNWSHPSTLSDFQTLHYTRKNLAHNRLLIAVKLAEPVKLIAPPTFMVSKSIVHKDNVIIAGGESLFVFKVGSGSPIHTVRAAPYKKDITLLDITLLPLSTILSLSTLPKSPLKLYLSPIPLDSVLCGEGLTASSVIFCLDDCLLDAFKSKAYGQERFSGDGVEFVGIANGNENSNTHSKVLGVTGNSFVLGTYAIWMYPELQGDWTSSPNTWTFSVYSEILLFTFNPSTSTLTFSHCLAHELVHSETAVLPGPNNPLSNFNELCNLSDLQVESVVKNAFSQIDLGDLIGISLGLYNKKTVEVFMAEKRFMIDMVEPYKITDSDDISTTTETLDIDWGLGSSSSNIRAEITSENFDVGGGLDVVENLNVLLINESLIPPQPISPVTTMTRVYAYPWLTITDVCYCLTTRDREDNNSFECRFAGFKGFGDEVSNVQVVSSVKKEKKKKRMQKQDIKHDGFARGKNRAMKL